MEPTSFINVDLELSSKENLAGIENELGKRVFVLQSGFESGDYILNFECSLNETDAVVVIEELLSLIESLSSESKLKLAACHKRVLDIGYDSGTEGVAYNNIPLAMLNRVIANGFDLGISVYPIDNSNEQNS